MTDIPTASSLIPAGLFKWDTGEPTPGNRMGRTAQRWCSAPRPLSRSSPSA